VAVRASDVPTSTQLATRERVRKWQQEHRERYRAYLQAYRERNRDELNAKRRARRDARREHVTDRYGLTLEQLDTWLEFQGECCALCGKHLRLPFHIDHDHDTGVIRGLLHARCNQFAWTSPNYQKYAAGWV